VNARESIFQGVRMALAPLKERAAYPAYGPEVAEPQWLAHEADSEALFQKRLTLAGGIFFADAAVLGAWLTKEQAQKVYIAPGLDALAAELPGELNVTRKYTRDEVDVIDAAITLASGGIAESGTVILTDADTPDRLAALAPWRHVIALPRTKLYRTVGEALAHLPPDPNVIWVTGPSKTADVEGILIQGVHGPGQQGCVLI